jgi:DNA-binding MarR family transcriptional regulator
MQGNVNDPSIGLLVAATRRRLKQVIWSRLVPYNLTPQQFWVILHLHQGRPMSLHELAKNIWADDPTACRIVARLTERKLVRAEADPDDRRRFRLMLTPKGKKLGGELSGLAGEIKDGMERNLSAGERQALCGVLQRVVDNLDEMLGSDAEPIRKRARV